jgi:hypothetical protein
MCLRAHRAGRPRPGCILAIVLRVSVYVTYLALEIIVTGKQQSAGDRKGDRRDTANGFGDLQEHVVSNHEEEEKSKHNTVSNVGRRT